MKPLIPKIACPFCGAYESQVKDTRPLGDGIWRRRQCHHCGKRYSTREFCTTPKAHISSTHHNI